MSADFMKEPCEHCPFRADVKPFLTARRGAELAYHTTNKYNTFPCHKTTVPDPDDESSNMITTSKSKECAGFLSMQIDNGAKCPDGFTPSEKVYTDVYDMVDAYSNE